jgi:hypothetical protein
MILLLWMEADASFLVDWRTVYSTLSRVAVCCRAARDVLKGSLGLAEKAV